MKDMSNFLKKRKRNYPDLVTDMIFVPYYYYSDGAKDNGHYDLRDLNAGLPKNIHMVVTGGKTFGVVSNEFLNVLKDNLTVKGAEYRPVQLWINWPVNDGSRNNLIMGGAKHYLQAQADSKKIYGVMLNPMMQSEALNQQFLSMRLILGIFGLTVKLNVKLNIMLLIMLRIKLLNHLKVPRLWKI